MAAPKGNKYACVQKGKPKERTRQIVEVAEQLISLSPLYNELLSAGFAGQKPDAAQREAMDRFERMFEFARPKLARKEIDVTSGGKPLYLPMEIIKKNDLTDRGTADHSS